MFIFGNPIVYQYMIYLDNHATTVCDPRVVDSMMPYFSTFYGNPASPNQFGELATEAIDSAANKIKKLIGGFSGKIVFTSGATESNNLAILGVVRSNAEAGNPKKIVTTLIEHKSVLEPIASLEKAGWIIEYLPVDSTGTVDLSAAEGIINNDTFLVSVQLANSEIGTIQPVGELAKLAERAGAYFHCDASQAIGKIPFDVEKKGIDFLSLSAHKMCGPKGIGALWIKPELESVVNPIMYGGESGNLSRPGTLPVPLIVGFGTACEICDQEENDRIEELRNYFESSLKKEIQDLLINGNVKSRLPNNSNISLPNIEADMLLANLPDVIVSTGSACESGSIEPSRILTLIGISREQAYNSFRVGLSRFTTNKEIDEAVLLISSAYHRISKLIQ